MTTPLSLALLALDLPAIPHAPDCDRVTGARLGVCHCYRDRVVNLHIAAEEALGAVLAERQRCAAIARDYDGPEADALDVSQAIARRIEAGEDPST